MIVTGGLTQYHSGRTLSIVLLVLYAIFPGRAGAQAHCDQAKQRIYRISETTARHVPDSLQTVLDLARFVRECEDEVSSQLELWLLNNEVFALDMLGRSAEASAKVDRFFGDYFDQASDLYRARFYLWRLHFNALAGDAVSMVVDYNEAKQYAGALDPTRRANLLLDGAYAYREINEFEISQKLVEEARALIGAPKTYEDSLALARATHAGAEAQMRQGTRLGDVMDSLRAASTLYEALGDTAQAAAIAALLGETYAAEGDTSLALAEMATGAFLARQSGSVRSMVYALYRQGQLLRESGDLGAAEESLLQAQAASETFREFRLRILYELARLYEQREDYDRAASFYQTVIDAPKPSSFVEELEAERKAREGSIRILLLERERNRRRLGLAFGGLLLLLGFVGAGYFLYVRRRRALIEQLRSAVVIPENLRTGLTLQRLTQRFQQNVDAELFGTRLARLYAVLFDPDLVLPYLDDPFLARQVEADSIGNNTSLFLCAAAVEEAIEGRAFHGNPANTLGAYLRGEFRKRDWEWPKNPLAWKQHFMDYHVAALF